MKKITENLSIPKNIVTHILMGNGIIACPLLSRQQFIDFCRSRELILNAERLIRLERLGLFSPIFTIQINSRARSQQYLTIPLKKKDSRVKDGWKNIKTASEIKGDTHDECEAYYSVFQIFELRCLLESMTFSLQMDGFLSTDKEINWEKEGKKWLEIASGFSSTRHEFRFATALLCQYISDRYYPNTQGDMRTVSYPTGGNIDQLMYNSIRSWDWWEYAKAWNAKKVEKLFELTPKKLEHAYTIMSVEQAHTDPLERWYHLIQFVDLRERKKLKDKALYAETIRSGALMLRLLYRDLYNKDLPIPNEMVGQVINYIPELEIRADIRRYLEFVSNRFHLNPQPKLVLFVEGEGESVFIKKIFEAYMGAHHGVSSIEIVCLGGVEAATGSKKEDRFRAILRLIDYLHHHQTFTFLILDNEGYAKRLKDEARKAKSSHHRKRFVTRPEYIKIWRRSFEFDNFSCTEIANAMTTLAKKGKKKVIFTQSDVLKCKVDKNPGAALSALYQEKADYGLPKVELSEELLKIMMSNKTKKKIANRPIIKTLDRIKNTAAKNPLPTMQKIWEKNQSSRFLGKKRRNAPKNLT